jgi:hypothetical protein
MTPPTPQYKHYVTFFTTHASRMNEWKMYSFTTTKSVPRVEEWNEFINKHFSPKEYQQWVVLNMVTLKLV